MSDILLSFCIPTYNRPERINTIIHHILNFQSKEIEIVISDDNPKSDKTKNIIKNFKDPRIKYFYNTVNLGYDANLLLTIRRAKGKYVFLLMDEDDVELKSLPWILEVIKKNPNLTQIRGSLDNKTLIKPKYYYKLEDKYLNQCPERILDFFPLSIHASGIVLKKKALNIDRAKKYIGFFFIQQVLIAQAMIAGSTLCSSKIFAYVGKDKYDSMQPLIKGKRWWHPIPFLYIIKIRIQIIYDITKGLKNKKNIRKRFINDQKKLIMFNLFDSLFYDSFNFHKSFKTFLEGITYVITMKSISMSFNFWIEFLIYFLSKLKFIIFNFHKKI